MPWLTKMYDRWKLSKESPWKLTFQTHEFENGPGIIPMKEIHSIVTDIRGLVKDFNCYKPSIMHIVFLSFPEDKPGFASFRTLRGLSGQLWRPPLEHIRTIRKSHSSLQQVYHRRCLQQVHIWIFSIIIEFFQYVHYIVYRQKMKIFLTPLFLSVLTYTFICRVIFSPRMSFSLTTRAL